MLSVKSNSYPHILELFYIMVTYGVHNGYIMTIVFMDTYNFDKLDYGYAFLE